VKLPCIGICVILSRPALLGKAWGSACGVSPTRYLPRS